jgi:hypothetical protein
VALFCSFSLPSAAQTSAPPPDQKPGRFAVFRDTLDGKFDLSRHLQEAHGFVPVPIMITEPALGDIGGGLAIVFMRRQPQLEQSAEQPTFRPDMTAVAGAYTGNDSWFAGGGRIATIPSQRLRYRVGGAYLDMNLDFYEEGPSGEDRAFSFNLRSAPFFASLGRELWDPRLALATQYIFASMDVELKETGDLPGFFEGREAEETVSSIGFMAEYDDRDNILTPNRGLIAQGLAVFSDDWVGSDVTYQKLDGDVCWFLPLGSNWSEGRNWISGFRFRWQQIYGDPPFYLLPYVGMRGVPAARYQGEVAISAETEQRWDFTRRWSAVGFGGVGKAFDSWDEVGDEDLVWGAGGGFRYLIARQYRVRMGVDIAKGPEDWAWYIVFGSMWFQ